jgi:DNA helicase IV
MKIGPVASLFYEPWEIRFETAGIRLPLKKEKLIPYKDIKYIQIKGKQNAWFFATGSIVTTESDHEELFPGLSVGTFGSLDRTKKFERTCYKKISEYFEEKIDPAKERLEEASNQLKNLESAKSYISTVDIWDHCKIPDQVVECIEHPLFRDSFQFFSPNIKSLLKPLLDIQEGNDEFINEINEKFIQQEMKDMKSWFDNEIEKDPLTELQRRACIVNPENTLVIASAGSGKTSTIIGKAAYLIKKGLAKPEDILLLTFTGNVRKELIERVDKMFKKMGLEGAQPEVGTFHSFGLKVISDVTGERPSIWGLAGEANGLLSTTIFEDIINKLKRKDASFYRKWLEFLATARVPVKRIHLFNSLEEYTDTISSYPYRYDDTRINPNPQSQIPVLSDDFVKSQEEVAIANLLWINGIDFEYEKRYDNYVPDKESGPYNPDFYYPDIDLWHEHFALDRKGRAPEFMKPKEYEEGVKWKRRKHKEHQTQLFETTSDDYFTGELDNKILEKLRDEYSSLGLEIKPRSDEEIEEAVKKFYTFSEFSFLRTFIKFIKSLELNEEDIRNKIMSTEDKYRANKFLDIIIPIYTQYQEDLNQTEEIDFEDMIINATEHIRSKEYASKYKYIIIDEFQDTSRDKANLIRSLKEQSEAKLFCVGDDWQSIYRFAGSDINLMYDFSREFGSAEVISLDRTFRCNKVIAELGSRFVEKNDQQITKKIQAREPQNDRSLNFHWINKLSHKNTEKVLSKVLNLDEGQKKDVFILNRNGRIMKDTNRQDINWAEIHTKFSHLNIKRDTVHQSKGLERTAVVLLGLEGGRAGFPNLMDDDPLIDCLLPREEKYPYAEERRLLYVSLTRAFDEVHVVATRNNKSPFFDELLQEAESFNPIIHEHDFRFKPVHPCPQCADEGNNDSWFSLMVNHNQIRNNPNLEKKVGMSCGKKDNNGDFHNTSRWPAECPICARRQTVRKLKVEEALDNANVVCEDENCDFKLDWQLLVP